MEIISHSNSDRPTLWESSDYPYQVYYYSELDSTMDTAYKLARGNCPGGTVVVAERQTKGRGRMTRVWHSEKGGLYFTGIWRPQLPLIQSARVGFAASLSMAESLRHLFGVDAKVKWPNDLLVHDRKIAGMLSQIEAEADRIVFLNIGIGLNVNNTPTELAPDSISLHAILNREVSRKKILFDFLTRFDTRIRNTMAMENVIDDWKAYTITLGRKVKIVTSQGDYAGTALDVDSSGALILQLEDGILQTVLYGDCFHQ